MDKLLKEFYKNSREAQYKFNNQYYNSENNKKKYYDYTKKNNNSYKPETNELGEKDVLDIANKVLNILHNDYYYIVKRLIKIKKLNNNFFGENRLDIKLRNKPKIINFDGGNAHGQYDPNNNTIEINCNFILRNKNNSDINHINYSEYIKFIKFNICTLIIHEYIHFIQSVIIKDDFHYEKEMRYLISVYKGRNKHDKAYNHNRYELQANKHSYLLIFKFLDKLEKLENNIDKHLKNKYGEYYDKNKLSYDELMGNDITKNVNKPNAIKKAIDYVYDIFNFYKGIIMNKK